MKTILTPNQLYNHIFSLEENYTPSVVREEDIVIAESRYLLPIVGENLYNRLLEGGYAELRLEYVVPMLCAWTRYLIEPLLRERCGLDHATSTTDAELLARLKMVATSYSRRLSDYLNSNVEEFEEYNPIDNPLNHCSIDGNIVQIY